MLLLIPTLLVLLEGAQSDPEISRLIDRLGSDFLEDRETARKDLEKAGMKAEPALLKGLASPDHRVRQGCLEVLGGLKSSKARAPAAQLFSSDEDAGVQETAFALLRLLGLEAEDELLQALNHELSDIRRGAVETLTTLRSPKAVEPLAALFKRETNKVLRDAAFKSLLSMGALAEGFLLTCLGSGEVHERREALAALREVQTPAALERIGKLFAVETDADALKLAGEYLEKSVAKAEPAFLAALKGVREGTRVQALQGLGVLKSRAGLEGAAGLLLADPSEAVRVAAAEYLAGLGGPEAEAAFLKGLAGANPAVRLLSIRKLGELKSRKPLEPVAGLFRSDKDPSVRRACFDYLRRLGPAAERELLLAMSDEDRLFRIEAVRALGEAGAEAAIPRLVLLLGELDPELRAAAEQALARLGLKGIQAAKAEVAAGRLKPNALETVLAIFNQGGVEALLDGLVTDEGGTGFFAGQFKALGELGPEVVGPVLLRMAQDPRFAYRKSARRDRIPGYDLRLRELAVRALGELAVPGAAEPLERLLKETEPGSVVHSLHEEAILSLHRLGNAAPLEAYLGAAEARVAELLRKNEGMVEVCELLQSQGMFLNRIGRRDASRLAYERLLSLAEPQKPQQPTREQASLAMYNLACLASLGGEKVRALDWLEKAVQAGYRDRAWIDKDRELDGIRGEARFQRLFDEAPPPPKPEPPK